MSNTQLTIIPQGANLPAHLQTADIAAQIAAQNAAAAGGIKTGGFPKISIEGSKFHESHGGETRTLMVPSAAPGQPPLPMMCLEVVIIAANPALIKTYYAAQWVKGSDAAPECQSTNGITPDAHVVNKQSPVCATCKQNAWGSKISAATGKEVKACSDSKQLVVLPAGDLSYKALGLAVTPAALGDWGKFVKALSERNIPVNSIVVNITFDHTASFPKLQFAYNRFLSAEDYAKVRARAEGDDVRAIVSPAFPAALPALPAPAAATAIAASIPAPAPVAAAPVAPQVGFGTASAPAAIAVPIPDAPKRTRAPRVKPAEIAADLSHLPAALQAAVLAVGADTPAGKAILAQFPAPAPIAPVSVVPTTGFANTTVATTTAAPATATVPVFLSPTIGFGSPADAAPAAIPAAGVVVSALSLKEILQRKLGITPPAQE